MALIKNDAILNEELDPKLMIARLKREVAELKEELAMATGEQRTDLLSEEDIERWVVMGVFVMKKFCKMLKIWYFCNDLYLSMPARQDFMTG